MSTMRNVDVKMYQAWELLERSEDTVAFGFLHVFRLTGCDIDSIDKVGYAQTFQCRHTDRKTLSKEYELTFCKKQSAEYISCGVRTTCLTGETEVDESFVVLTLVTWTLVDHLTDIEEDFGRKIHKSGRHLDL